MSQPPRPDQPRAYLSGPAYHAPQQPTRTVEAAALPRSVPALTVYANHDCNLNAEASGLVARFAGICLREPPAVRQGRRPQLWELGPGECTGLRSHSGQLTSLRFRAPVAPPPGHYLLLPVAGAAERFSLWPLPTGGQV